MALPAERDNLVRWKDSGQPRAWVEGHGGIWNHQDWLTLLQALKDSEFWPMEPDAVGCLLEDLKRVRHDGSAEPAADDQALSSDQHTERLLTHLDTDNYGAKEKAIEELVHTGFPAIGHLISAIRNAPSYYTKRNAKEALARIRDPRGFEILRSFLNDGNEDVRASVAGSLGHFKDSRAVDPLIEALKDPKLKVREEAAVALGEIGEKWALLPLISVFYSSPGISQSMLYALSLMNDQNADNILIEVMKRGEIISRRAQDFLNRKRKSEDEFLLCPQCDYFLGTRKDCKRRSKRVKKAMRSEGMLILGAYYIACPHCSATALVE